MSWGDLHVQVTVGVDLLTKGPMPLLSRTMPFTTSLKLSIVPYKIRSLMSNGGVAD
jgi:hypothetical protein